ncbi:rhomboid family intramembrane serine protease [Rhodopirellula sp. JC740]|uniref:Rhomboid family intramembrane serine protease n=1 Tax=Rhodopirellula halodulae TaxID=2894198 RepID=A0ABS8NN26_9BACT|nr:rhomboid family intramembrane serine protease [Rhodopirellula sp. JC740]MCC9644916.1 rhomboid family intramembrane serine protease [Rhodopirellula sp. JC740]
MRRIGGFTDPKLADQFNDYLQTQQIASKVDHDGESHDIWIRDEKDVDHARTALQEFTQSPNSAKFDVSAEAARLRKEQEAEKKRKLSMQRKSQQSLRGSSGSFGGRATMSGPIPVVIGMIIVCGLASYATSFGNPRPNRNLPDRLTLEAIESGDFLSFEQKLFSAFCFADPIQYQKTDDPWVSIKKGELWRFITPAFLHGSPMHLVFNMMALFTLGSVVERLHGSWFLALLLIVCQIVGTLVQVLLPDWLESPMAIGASGAVFGVFGYIWIRPKFQPSYPVGIPPFNVYLMLGFMFACMTPLIQGIANGAHVGGLVIGMVIAAALPKSFG